MARPGVNEPEIREAIAQLVAEGDADSINVAKIRDRLGTGSYSTLSRVLKLWRTEQASGQKPSVPEMPESVQGLLNRVWAEAWASADQTYQTERRSYLEQQQKFSETEKDMAQEIAHLEEQNHAILQELKSLQDQQNQANIAQHKAELELVKQQTRADALEQELNRLRETHRQQGDKLTDWITRATQAESKIATSLTTQAASTPESKPKTRTVRKRKSTDA